MELTREERIKELEYELLAYVSGVREMEIEGRNQ